MEFRTHDVVALYHTSSSTRIEILLRSCVTFDVEANERREKDTQEEERKRETLEHRESDPEKKRERIIRKNSTALFLLQDLRDSDVTGRNVCNGHMQDMQELDMRDKNTVLVQFL